MATTPQKLYKELLKNLGKPNWWPVDKKYHDKTGSDPRFEIIVGAILTQNTNWPNVEKALSNLKTQKMIDVKKIAKTDMINLKKLIRPSGFFNQKAERLKNLSMYLKDNYYCDLDKFFDNDIQNIRNELLSINGVGPETADSILLYAGHKPIFVIDAYTKRVCERLPIYKDLDYDKLQNLFQNNLLKKYDAHEVTSVYSELHALIVDFAKILCKKKPDCQNCFFNEVCAHAKRLTQ